MKTFKLYQIDSDSGIVDFTQKKEITYTLREVKDVRDAVEQLRPYIDEAVRQYTTVRNNIMTTAKIKYYYERPVPAFSGTNSYFLTIDIVKEYEGLIFQCHFLLCEEKQFRDEKIK